MTTRVSKEPERPRRFHRQSGWGDRNRQLPGPRWDAHDRGEQTTGDTMVSAREEIERVETDGGESERPIVSMKRGNHPRDPVERRGRHVMTPLEGNMAGASKPGTVYTNQQRSRRRVRDGLLSHSGSRPVACHDMTSRMRKCKYGSGGVRHEATDVPVMTGLTTRT